jgi:hypothetical protein
MTIKSPNERVYYYECSYGKFRLIYHIPPSELEKLSKQNKIEKQVLEDYPDGLDLRVEETDYKDLGTTYGYRPEVDPETAKKLFYMIYSATKDWKKNTATGLIAAKDIENKILDLEKNVRERLLSSLKKTGLLTTPIKKDKESPHKELKHYRMARKTQFKKQKELDNHLRKHVPKIIDPKQTLQNQRLSKIEWTEGENIKDILTKTQQKRRQTT